MISKFATVAGSRAALLVLAGMLAGAATTQAQDASTQPPPAQEQPAAQPPAETPQSSSQDTALEDTLPGRKAKVHPYKKWTFNVGGGASLTTGATKNFVRGGGGVAGAGVARNYSRYLGLRFDFQWDNLPLRNTALQLAQAPGATNHAYSFMLDPIIYIPVTQVWSGYLLGGGSFYHRSGKLDSSSAIPGSACNAFFNFGGGIARKVRGNVEIYGEFRILHGKHNGITTDLRPITVGVRW
jgi:hypothetical protein